MSTLQFKSNIKCSGCANTVKPFLDKVDGVTDWSVDFASQDKLLTVQTKVPRKRKSLLLLNRLDII